jgi:ABC-type bacteriocin/lantibiotic exporter with double-glycine peptidase domain
MPPAPTQTPRKKVTKQTLRAVLPDLWVLIRPRRGLLALSFVLMVINRVAGLVLPYSSKFLFDNVIGKHHVELLKSLVLLVLLATATQGATSFALTQLLSKCKNTLAACRSPSMTRTKPVRWFRAS